ncbi:hypothetical protein MBLNU13_g05897t1 [Cladosporium sp. NU13]
MAFSNSSSYLREGNIRSLSTQLAERYAENAPPCCHAYVAGAGHDWTCRLSGHAFDINYGQPDGSNPRPGTNDSVRSASAQPLLSAPPAYSAVPREHEFPFREFPPTYDSIVCADRFYFVRHLPGGARVAHPPARALNEAELAAMGVHIGNPPARRSIRQACVAKLTGDLSWVMLLIIALAFLLGFLVMKYA